MHPILIGVFLGLSVLGVCLLLVISGHLYSIVKALEAKNSWLRGMYGVPGVLGEVTKTHSHQEPPELDRGVEPR